jgi:hypothetical protein
MIVFRKYLLVLWGMRCTVLSILNCEPKLHKLLRPVSESNLRNHIGLYCTTHIRNWIQKLRLTSEKSIPLLYELEVSLLHAVVATTRIDSLEL